MHTKTIKPLSTLAITTILALQSLTVFATEDPDKIIIVGTKPKPGLPGCMDLGTCTPGDPSPRGPGEQPPPVEAGAKIPTLDTRCHPEGAQATSRDSASDRHAAAHDTFTNALSAANISMTAVAGKVVTVTYADGGTEKFRVTLSTYPLVPMPGSLVQGNGQPTSCEKSA